MHIGASFSERIEPNGVLAADAVKSAAKRIGRAVRRRARRVFRLAADTAAVVGMAASTVGWLAWEIVVGTERYLG